MRQKHTKTQNDILCKFQTRLELAKHSISRDKRVDESVQPPRHSRGCSVSSVCEAPHRHRRESHGRRLRPYAPSYTAQGKNSLNKVAF